MNVVKLLDDCGVMMFNRGNGMLVRALVALYSLRRFWDGNISFFLEEPYPPQFIKSLEYFNCKVIYNDKRHDYKTLVRKNSLFENPPYPYTLWMDIDTVTVGKIDEMFSYLIDNKVDLCIPSFCGWVSTGNHISKRIKRFEGIAEQKYIDEALKEHPAVNTGILSFKKSDKWSEFVRYWTELAEKGSKAHIFIPDEVACQILYPSMSEWGLKYFIAPTDFNVSVLHDHGLSKDRRIIHYHGDKHVLDHPNCELWKNIFKEMCDKNIADMNSFVQYADKRLKKYINAKTNPSSNNDVTIVTACDAHYVSMLQHTFANWRKYKNIDKNPVIVFVNGIDLSDNRLDFLRLPNVRMIPWEMKNAENHREEMLSAFVFGTAEYVETDYWMKLDADSYATDYRPLYDDKMKQYAFCGHKWGYSRPDHIKMLDEWAKTHWKRKLRKAPPMITEGKIEGRRFYHKVKRTISFAQMHRTKFTRFCVKLLKEHKLPAPTQDTFMFYVANRFNPETVGVVNFKKNYGFTQGNGKLPIDAFVNALNRIDEINSNAAANVCGSSIPVNNSCNDDQPCNYHNVIEQDKCFSPKPPIIDDIVIEIREIK